MLNKKNDVVTVQNLTELQENLGIYGASKIQLNFKMNKVTASCKINGYCYGSNGLTLQETLNNLIRKVICEDSQEY